MDKIITIIIPAWETCSQGHYHCSDRCPFGVEIGLDPDGIGEHHVCILGVDDRHGDISYGLSPDRDLCPGSGPQRLIQPSIWMKLTTALNHLWHNQPDGARELLEEILAELSKPENVHWVVDRGGD